MYGETAAIRKRAAALREQGTDVRAIADRLVAQADAIDWQGRAADGMRARMRERATRLRECAGSHENAAESLERHVAEVDRLKDAIADIERKVTSLVADAKTRVAEIESHDDPDGDGIHKIRREPTPEDTALTQFTPPPSGHKDWLVVSLPGL